jgi:hypothetical protein
MILISTYLFIECILILIDSLNGLIKYLVENCLTDLDQIKIENCDKSIE